MDDLDDLSAHRYCGELDRLIIEDEGQLAVEAVETSALVRSIYKAGEPLYSKHALREILTYLKSGSDEVKVKAIDGRSVLFRREVGGTYETHESSTYNWQIGNPFILFCSVQEILENVQQYPTPIALCSVWIYHDLIKRNKMTGELLPPMPNQSESDVAKFFCDSRKAWEADKACSQLRAVLSNTVKHRITKIIAFACGSMAFSNRIPRATNSAYQHALILTVKDIISAQKDHPAQIECYVQDPDYRDLDRTFLAPHGIEILESPEGFLEIDDSSIVLSFAPNIAVRQIVADLARPALMIWDQSRSMTTEIEDEYRTDPDSPRLTTMLTNFYKSLSFPGHLSEFRGLAIYVRNDASDQNERL